MKKKPQICNNFKMGRVLRFLFQESYDRYKIRNETLMFWENSTCYLCIEYLIGYMFIRGRQSATKNRDSTRKPTDTMNPSTLSQNEIYQS